MRRKKSVREHASGLVYFLDTVDPFCKKMIICTLLITFIELLTIGVKIVYGIYGGTVPLPAVYIPIVKNILIFAVIMFFFAFLFDSLARKEESQ